MVSLSTSCFMFLLARMSDSVNYGLCSTGNWNVSCTWEERGGDSMWAHISFPVLNRVSKNLTVHIFKQAVLIWTLNRINTEWLGPSVWTSIQTFLSSLWRSALLFVRWHPTDLLSEGIPVQSIYPKRPSGIKYRENVKEVSDLYLNM